MATNVNCRVLKNMAEWFQYLYEASQSFQPTSATTKSGWNHSSFVRSEGDWINEWYGEYYYIRRLG